MKPLNRPMFKNGGPIKEGIMSGMKEPQAINTVGSPLAPTDSSGRQGYAFQILPFLGLTGGTAARVGGTRAATSLLPRITQGFKNIFQTQKPAPFSPVTIGQSKGGKLLNLKPVVKQGGKGPDVKDIAQVSELKPYFANDPTIALVRGTYNAITNPQAKGLFAKGARFVLSPTGVITGGYFAGGKFFDGEGNQIDDKTAKESGLTAGNKIDEKIIKGESDGSTKALNRDEEIEANRKRYYKLMGIDKMNKNAAYNSLIDASKIIQEEGGDLKGSLKSGTLQNRIIQAISGNLDKSADLKKQIDAAILKGEITKDINKEKDQLDAQVKRKQLEVYDKKLKGNDLSEVASLYAKDGRSLKGQNLYAEATRQGIDVKGIFDTKKVDDFMADNTTKTEADYINEEQKRREKNNEDLLPPGDYVVGGRIVTVSEGGLVSDFVF